MRCRWVLLAGLLVFSHPFEAVTARVFEGRYRLALGRPDHPIDKAVVWVYVIGWGGLDRVEAGVVRGGVVHVRLDSADVPVPTPESFLVAIEFPDGRWYRGPDFPHDGGNSETSAEEFIGAFDAYFRRLSPAKALADSAPLLVLPAFVERRVRLLHEDGSPLVGRQVPIDVYVTQRNHCGAHRGLHFAEPLAVETTDERGQVVFMSQPGVGLYLDTPSKPKVSPADSPWVWRELSVGIKTDTTNAIVIRRRWEEVERKTVTLEIRDHAGRPAAGHGALWVGAGAPCGFFGIMFGPTDSAGRVDMEIPAELTSEIQIFQRAVDPAPRGNNDKLSELSEEQRGRLVRDGWLAATLPAPK